MDGSVIIGTKLETKSFDAQIEQVERKLNDMVADYETLSKEDGFNEQSNEAIILRQNIEKCSNELVSLREKQSNLNKAGFNSFQASVEKTGSSLKKVTRRITKMALAVFGIRSAFMFVRSAINTIAGDDEQLKADIDYMKSAIAYTLEPLIRGIVNLAKQLMFYLKYIVQAWTGKNIFANANKGLDSANKKAKQLQKTTASFDEMNSLNNNENAGTTAPSFDLTAPENIDPPDWIVWIADNKDIVIAGLLGIAAALLVLKLGLTGLLGGVIIGLIVALVALIFQNWDTISALLGTIGEWIWNNVCVPIWNFIKALLDTIWSIIKTTFSLIQGIFTTLIEIFKSPFKILAETVSGVFNGIKTTIQGVFNIIKGLFTGDWKTVMNGFKQIFKGVFDTLWSIAKAPLNLIIDGINALIKGANKISFDIPSWVPGLGGKKFGINLKTIPRLAKGTIVNAPGKGVLTPSGTALYGEAGPEAYIPLSDTRLLEQLGSTLGKYITINLTNVTELDGRQIARKVDKIQQNNNFVLNR